MMADLPLTSRDGPAPRVRRVVHLVAGGVLAFAIWASVAPLPTVVRAPALVVVDPPVNPVQAPDDGRISRIFVAVGDSVVAGQVVAQMDTALLRIALDDLDARAAALDLQLLRLDAETRPDTARLDFAADLTARAPAAARRERALFDARIAQYQGSRAVLADIRAARAATVTMQETLVARGAVSMAALIAARQALLDIDRQITELRTGFQVGRAQRAADLGATLAQVHAESALRRVQLDLATLRAPVGGVVDRIAIAGEGAVVAAGAPLLEIAPQAGAFVLLARVAPGDIAPVTIGMAATIRLTAYADRRFSSLHGHVTRISEATRQDPAAPAAGAFYEVTIALEDADLPGITLRPGMIAAVQLSGAETTVLAAFLSPLLQAGGAFRP